ncbi:MAG: ABC transporter permease subunit [Bacilli bacterium]|nr:ABC transporter permease subunit [Bacilli bacterium]
MMKYRLKVVSTQIIIIIVLLTLWEYGAKTGIINSFIFSSPSKIISTLVSLVDTGEIFVHLGVTLGEVLLSFTLGILIAFILSVVMYESKFLADILDPFLTVLNSLPKVALGPIIIIWVGANTNAIITMALMINVIISIITIYTGFMHTDPLKVKLFKSFKASNRQILCKLVIPANISTIMSSLKINISLTLIGS